MGWPSHYTRFHNLGTLLKSSGTNDSITVNKLVDSGATFVADGVVIGHEVVNVTDSTRAIVTAVDGETTLSLDTDIFPAASGDTYQVGGYLWETINPGVIDNFDPQAILIGSGGTSNVSDMKITPKGSNNAETLKLINNVIHPIAIKRIHVDVTDGADIVIFGNSK